MISTDSGEETIAWLEGSLAEMGVPQKEILRAELLMEENLLRLAHASGNEEGFSAKITIKKRLGDVSLRISAKGEAYNPIVSLDEMTEDKGAMLNLAILKAYRDQLSYNRRNGENVVSILAHSSGSKTAIYTLTGLVLGCVLGVLLKGILSPEAILWVDTNIFLPVQNMFMNALMMLVAPLIFLSVLSGIMGMSDASEIGRMGGKLIAVSMVKMAAVVGLGMVMGLCLGGMPEIGGMLEETAEAGGKSVSVLDVIVGIIPGNMVSPFSANNLLQVLFLACFFGLLLVKAGDRTAGARGVVEFLDRLIKEAMEVVLFFMPFAVAASMANLMVHTELSTLLLYGKLIVAGHISVVLVLLIFAIFVLIMGRISPKPFLQKVVPFLVLPFSLRSSSGCMAETLKLCAEKLGIEEKLAMFSIPVGMQFNMVSGGLYEVMLTIVMCQTYEVPMDTEFFLSFFFASMLLICTAPAVAGGGAMLMASMFGMFGVPVAAVMLFIGIESIMDPICTASNVAGNISSSFILARMEGKVDEAVYQES